MRSWSMVLQWITVRFRWIKLIIFRCNSTVISLSCHLVLCLCLCLWMTYHPQNIIHITHLSAISTMIVSWSMFYANSNGECSFLMVTGPSMNYCWEAFNNVFIYTRFLNTHNYESGILELDYFRNASEIKSNSSYRNACNLKLQKRNA